MIRDMYVVYTDIMISPKHSKTNLKQCYLGKDEHVMLGNYNFLFAALLCCGSLSKTDLSAEADWTVSL